jgi:hypothetical protein
VGALSCSSSPTRTGPDPRPSSRRSRSGGIGDHQQRRRRRQQQHNSSSPLLLVASSSLHGPGGGRREGARRRTGTAFECAGPCCAAQTRQHRTAPLPERSPREQGTAGTASTISDISIVSEPSSRRWVGLPRALQCCYVVNDPVFNAATLLSSAKQPRRASVLGQPPTSTTGTTVDRLTCSLSVRSDNFGVHVSADDPRT